MIELDLSPGAMEVLGFWRVDLVTSDYLVFIYRKRSETRWTVSGRLRFYSGTKDPFDGTDEKRWMTGTSSAPPAVLVMQMDATVNAIAEGARITRVIVNGDGRKAWELLTAQPWAHIEIHKK